ncbi:MAG: DUF2281 domain-containing protein [Anaerolineae bacterium]
MIECDHDAIDSGRLKKGQQISRLRNDRNRKGCKDMVALERIQQVLLRLPPSYQTEVLDFTEYLLAKAKREAVYREDDWSSLSLSFAMRGMEDEETPTYALSDLTVVFA